MTPVLINTNGESGSERRSRGEGGAATSTPYRNGHDGADAVPALDGKTAGNIIVELEPAESSSDAFLALNCSFGSRSAQNVPVGSDLVISAIGGDGEDGKNGGDGSCGYAGGYGRDATKDSEATDGSPGGKGGDAGRGTDGGDGGHGGFISVTVKERDMHWLYAVETRCEGGKGGEKGHHGVAGSGGSGGQGGGSYSWQELDHYKRVPVNEYNSETKEWEQIGWDEKPVYRTIKRFSAERGPDGPTGWAPGWQLSNGQNGRSGFTHYIVHDDHDGSKIRYTSKFDMMLQDFQITDQNKDGIYEPGECLLVDNVQIRNNAQGNDAMPTPRFTPIPIHISCNGHWAGRDSPIQMVRGSHVPRNIRPSEFKIITKAMSAQILHPLPSETFGNIFKTKAEIGLVATMPDMDRQVSNFTIKKTITIQYPLCMKPNAIKYLDSVPAGAMSCINMTVANSSTKALGTGSPSRRRVEFRVSAHDSSQVILGVDDEEVEDELEGPNSVDQEVALIRPKDTTEISEQMMLSAEAEEYSEIELTISLRAQPADTSRIRQHQTSELVDMQQQVIKFQVSNNYRHNPSSDFLLITSNRVSSENLQGWCTFIRDELHLEVDIWNVSQYGGLKEDEWPVSILANYAGKAVMALDDTFKLQQSRSRNILDFIEAAETLRLTTWGTSFTFVRQEIESSQATLEHLNVIAGSRLSEVSLVGPQGNALVRSTISYHAKSENDFFKWLNSNHRAGFQFASGTARYKVDVEGDLDRRGRKLSKRLDRMYPRDRFIVTAAMDSTGLDVLHCNPQGQQFSVRTTGNLSERAAQDTNGSITGLSLAEAYSVISALPFRRQLDLLYSASLYPDRYDDWIRSTLICTVTIQLHQQIACLARQPRWSHNLFNAKQVAFSTGCLLGASYDKVTEFLEHQILQPTRGPGSRDLLPVGEQILISIVQSARCQNKRQLVAKLLNPLRRTRSHLKRGILARIEGLIASSEVPMDDIKGNEAKQQSRDTKKRVRAFKKSARQHLRRKDHERKILESISELTDSTVIVAPVRDQLLGQVCSIESVFAKSRYVTLGEHRQWQTLHIIRKQQQEEDLQLVAELQSELRLLTNGPRITTPVLPAPRMPIATASLQSLSIQGYDQTQSNVVLVSEGNLIEPEGEGTHAVVPYKRRFMPWARGHGT